jgi:hypothetical protein
MSPVRPGCRAAAGRATRAWVRAAAVASASPGGSCGAGGCDGPVAVGRPAGPTLHRWARVLAQSLLPGATGARQQAWVGAGALTLLGLGLAASALWTSAQVNLFVDTHRAVMVEVDALLYLMGVLSGGAWYALLDRQGWLGFLATPAMALMVVGAGFTGAGWC